jgi:glycosyltransferase involved in cell wall biosynthesis
MSDRPLTVLFVHQHPDNVAGQELSLRDRIIGLREAGIESRVLLPAEGIFAELLRRVDVPVRFTPLSTLSRRNPLPYLQTVRRVRKVIRAEGADIVHCSGAFPCQYSLPAARLAGVPCVVHINTTIYTPASYRRNLIRHADLVLAVSHAVERHLRSSIPIDPGKIRVIYNGIADPGCHRDEAAVRAWRAEQGLGSDWRCVGQFATVIPRKGCEQLIAAAARVVVRHPRVRFYFVGRSISPEYARELSDLARKLGLEDRVVFTGFQGDVVGWLHRMDITVLYSLHEGLGRAVVESQLAKRPVIGAAVGGIVESIEHGVTGLLVPPGDREALAEAIETLLENPAVGARLAETACARARDRHDVRRQAEELAACYRKMLAR